ncbi:MAG: VWA domain-containing protein [Asticcacaulis sp.]|uniref:TadE/TadG family type IV pilus assembly protein n=1 Tax=Asticcacaulis sp. TaxID=1872648 RepID=UPI003F7B557F
MSILSAFNRFRRDRRGNVLMIFGLSVFAIVGAAGAALDMSDLQRIRMRLQDAADTAVLRTMPLDGYSDAQRQTAADRAFADNFGMDGVKIDSQKLTRISDSNAITETYAVSATTPSTFGALFGKDAYTVHVSSTAKKENTVYQIALVLDNTGSMQQMQKMQNLKMAVKTALNGLLTSGKNVSNSQVAVVPFSEYVKLDSATLNGMVTAGQVKGTGDCVSDRDQPYDVSSDAATKAIPASVYQRVVCGSKLQNLLTVRGLTSNIASVQSYVDQMQWTDTTNITIGVQWGMEVLSQAAPFVATAPSGAKNVKKVMIVVTDGDNTQNRFKDSVSGINARTAKACENAKALGIDIYTVKVIEGSSSMLGKCASSPDQFYDLKTASQLNAAMSGIFADIYKTRLTS